MDDRRQMANAAGVAAIPRVTSSTPRPPSAPPGEAVRRATVADWEALWTEALRFAIDRAGRQP